MKTLLQASHRQVKQHSNANTDGVDEFESPPIATGANLR